MATSPNATYQVGAGATVTDSKGNIYTISAAGRIIVNGKEDATTDRVDGLGFYNGQVWQKNADNHWYSKASVSAPWVGFPASSGLPFQVTVSFDYATITATPNGPVGALYDSNGNTWSINAAGQVVIDGQADPTTAQVIKMDYVSGLIWQENKDGNWYSKVKPSDTWTSAVQNDPILAALDRAGPTYRVGPGATVTDGKGGVYVINNYGQITINGKVDPTTAHVDGLGFADGKVWQKNADNLWYSKTSVSAQWVDRPASAGVPIPGQYSSPDNSAASFITDASLNQWTINQARQIVIDGQVDPTTDRVFKLEYVNGRVWQENADGNWYSKLRPSDPWSAAITKDPLNPTAQVWRGGQGGNPALGSNWSQGQVLTPNQTLIMVAGTMNLGSGNLAGNPLLIAGGSTESVAPVINMTAGGSLKLAGGGPSPGGIGSNNVAVHLTGGTANLDVNTPVDHAINVSVTADASSSVLLTTETMFGRVSVAGGTTVLGGITVWAGDLSVAGTTVLTGSSYVSGNVFLGGDIGGTGSLTMDVTRFSSNSTLEVAGKIGSGATLAIAGWQHANNVSMVLDNAAGDKGTIKLSNALLEIKATGVDSVSYQNAVLSLYHGSSVVEAIKLVADGPLLFAKSAAGNVYAYDLYSAPTNVLTTLLPTHVG